MRLRPAEPADEPAVRQLVIEAYRHYQPRIGRSPAPMTPGSRHLETLFTSQAAIEQLQAAQVRLVERLARSVSGSPHGHSLRGSAPALALKLCGEPLT
jgi:hypothetical protein